MTKDLFVFVVFWLLEFDTNVETTFEAILPHILTHLEGTTFDILILLL